MAINFYPKYSKIRLSAGAGFKDVNGTLTDPTTVTFRYRSPGGSVTALVYGVDAEVIKDGTGLYHADVDCDVSGLWYYGVYGEGSVKAAKASSFVILSDTLN